MIYKNPFAFLHTPHYTHTVYTQAHTICKRPTLSLFLSAVCIKHTCDTIEEIYVIKTSTSKSATILHKHPVFQVLRNKSVISSWYFSHNTPHIYTYNIYLVL